jgi:hypothetical protein
VLTEPSVRQARRAEREDDCPGSPGEPAIEPAPFRLSALVPVKGPRRDTVADGVAIYRFFAAAGAGKGDGIVAFGRGDAKSGVFPFGLDARTWRRAHALARHPNHPSRPPQDAVASVRHRCAVAAIVQLDVGLTQREKERGRSSCRQGKPPLPAGELRDLHRRRGRTWSSGHECWISPRGRTCPPKVGKRRARCCSAMPAGEEGSPGTARREEPSGAMARGSQASASTSRSRGGDARRRRGGGGGDAGGGGDGGAGGEQPRRRRGSAGGEQLCRRRGGAPVDGELVRGTSGEKKRKGKEKER